MTSVLRHLQVQTVNARSNRSNCNCRSIQQSRPIAQERSNSSKTPFSKDRANNSSDQLINFNLLYDGLLVIPVSRSFNEACASQAINLLHDP